MTSHSPPNDSLHDGKEREERLASLSGAMALARLTHQVKELELQKDQQEKLTKPTFLPINCVVDTEILTSSLELVKRWTSDGGVNILVPLTVLEELDKSKKGNDPINIKTREVIRYLDRRTKSRPQRTTESTSGSLRVQASEEMFKEWEECEKMSTTTGSDGISKEDIPRHYRAMMNSVLFQRSKENEFLIGTEDAEMARFAKKWNVTSMSALEIDAASTKALQRYHREIKDYEGRKRTAARSVTQSQRQLWTPSK